MKKITFRLSCMITILISLNSCSQTESITQNEETFTTVSDYAYIGEAHNLLLDNIHLNFPSIDNIPNECQTKADAIEYIIQFNKKFITEANLSQKINKELMIERMHYYQNLVNYDNVCKSLSKNHTSYRAVDKELTNVEINDSLLTIEDINNSFVLLDQANALTMITDDAYEILKKLFILIQENYLGLTSDSTFELEVNNLIKRVDNTNYTVGDRTMETVGPVLSVSQYSLDWWKQNPDAIITEGKIAPWVALDIFGALDGIVSYAICTPESECNWKDAGISALVSGGLTSIGGTSKVLNLLRKLK